MKHPVNTIDRANLVDDQFDFRAECPPDAPKSGKIPVDGFIGHDFMDAHLLVSLGPVGIGYLANGGRFDLEVIPGGLNQFDHGGQGDGYGANAGVIKPPQKSDAARDWAASARGERMDLSRRVA